MSRISVFHQDSPGQLLFESTEHAEIVAELASEGVRFERWQTRGEIAPGAKQDEILAAYADDITRLQGEGGYQTVDVISLAKGNPNAAELRAKFLFEHTHSEDEVRFFVNGQGLFCLHLGEKVFQVLCQQGDLISVPAHSAHWFDMGSDPEFTAIRLFNNSEGWVARETGSDIARQFPLLD